MEKNCKKCGELKNLDEFYVHHRMKDGHLNFCKDCVIVRTHNYWYRNAEYLRLKEKERWQKRKLNKFEMERRKKYNKKWHTKLKIKAHNYCNKVLLKLKPSLCQLCKKEKKLVGHHPDYNDIYNVIWCCNVCHRKFSNN